MKDKILTFVRQKMLSTIPCTKFVLVHTSVENAGAILHTIERQKESCDIETEATQIVEELWREASDHIDTCTRAQKYAVISYNGETISGQKAWRLTPTPDSMPHDASEPPTSQGAMSMAMRFADSAMRLNMQVIGSQMQSAIEENERLRRRNINLEQRLDESFEMREQLRSQEHERQLELLESSRKADRLDNLLNQLKPIMLTLAPKIVSSLMRGLPAGTIPEKTLPSAQEKATDLLGKFLLFFETLSEEQVSKIFDILNESQQNLLGEFIMAFQAASLERKEQNVVKE